MRAGVGGQYVGPLYARELLAGGGRGVGYLLKDRVTNGAQFLDSIRRVAEGGTAMDRGGRGQSAGAGGVGVGRVSVNSLVSR